jgi:predicted SAM-dependent methyltransferase
MPILSSIKSGLDLLLGKHERDSGATTEDRDKLRVIVGAGEDRYHGWITTDRRTLDLLREPDWAFHFQPNTIDAILAEHVWEHLDSGAATTAAENCFKYLAPGGYIRVAVPDGLHPDTGYIDRVRPGGCGEGSEDHRVLYTYVTLRDVFESVGFDVTLLEYFDERGILHYHDWHPIDGMITRSKRFDARNQQGELAYTSIILDARKPTMIRTAQRRSRSQYRDVARYSTTLLWFVFLG